MTRFGTSLILAAFISLAARLSAPAQTNGGSPGFQEVYDLIRQHAVGVSEAELNRAAVQGLISALAPKVSLVTNDASGRALPDNRLITQKKFFEGDIAYFRIERVSPGLAEAVNRSYQELSSTNKVSGVVLDFRYSDGSDYEAAAHTADLFINKKQPLLNWNGRMLFSHEKTNAISVPVAILVNHETAGAPEALAAMLREAGAGMIIGSRTAGQAMLTEDFPIGNGERLRIESAPITLGDGSRLSTEGLKPDIDVTVSPGSERSFYADAFLVVPNTNAVANASTNLAGETGEAIERVPFNEAELVREHNAGENPDEETAQRPPEPKVPVVSDPPLARALDLLKGLAVVRQNRF